MSNTKKEIDPGPLYYLTDNQINTLSIDTLINYAYESPVDMILTLCYNRKDFAIAVTKNNVLMNKINNDTRYINNEYLATHLATYHLHRILLYHNTGKFV